MIVAFSGFLRCGTSLVGQMLYAGGMLVLGRPERFEVHMQPGPQKWMLKQPGAEPYAVKVPDPHVYRPPAGPEYRVIWLDRDPREQAKSTIKCSEAYSPEEHAEHMRGHTHKSVRSDIQRQLRSERPEAMRAWKAVTDRVLAMRFEQFVKDYPRGAVDCARRIQKFVGLDLDIDAMAAVVVKRRAGCLPYMLELK